MKRLEIHKQAFDWTDRDEWLAPKNDWSTPIHLRLVTDEIAWVVSHLDSMDTCIQAGGNIGLWPACYAKEFQRVITFEPAADSFACMESNLAELENVEIYNAAVGDSNHPVTLKYPPRKQDRSGACYVEPDKRGLIKQVRIDDIDVSGRIDLIHLDIEGGEFAALRGAANTIKQHQPAIVIENRPLAHMKEPARRAIDFLKGLGYQITAQRQYDVMLKIKPANEITASRS